MPRCTVFIGLFLVLVTASAALLTPPALTQARDPDEPFVSRAVIRWPTPEFPTLQGAIDAAPDGTKIKIAAGVYQLTQPLVIQNRRLIFEGACSGRLGSLDPITHFSGPDPADVVDRDGNIILCAESVVGLLNVFGGEVMIKKLSLSGFDAGIVFKDAARTAAPQSGALARHKVIDFAIARTGRGVLVLSSGPVQLEQGLIQQTLWNGVSLAPLVLGPKFDLTGLVILEAFGTGIYIENANALIDKGHFGGNKKGGVVGFVCLVGITETFLNQNSYAGVVMESCTLSVNDSEILHAFPLDNGTFGDGIVLYLSSAHLENNGIHDVDRSGVAIFGSIATLKNNWLDCCAAFDLNAEAYQNVQPTFVDAGKNECDCGLGVGACIAISTNLAPPAPVNLGP